MKKLFTILAITSLLFLGTTQSTYAQDAAGTEQADKKGFHQELKQRFIQGGPFFMGIVLIALILGLAIAIERIIFLTFQLQTQKN